jgi:hypothetical protein
MAAGRWRWSLATLLALAAPAAAPVPSHADIGCGELGRMGEQGPAIVTVRTSGVRCETAMTVLERYLAGRGTQGWTCRSAGEEGTCRRGGALASYGGARGVRRCGSVGFEPNSDNLAGGIRAKRASCRLARRVARGSHDAGATHPDPYRAAGFSCAGRPVDSALPLALYVCRRAGAIVVFARS